MIVKLVVNSILVLGIAIIALSPIWFLFILVNVLKKSATRYWNALLEKYHPRVDVCKKILTNSIDHVIIDGRTYGIGYKTDEKWTMILGISGLHVTPRCKLPIMIDGKIDENYLFFTIDSIEIIDDIITIKQSNDIIKLIPGIGSQLKHCITNSTGLVGLDS